MKTDKDEIQPWLRRWYDSRYEAWKRKVDAVDPKPAYKAAADRIDAAFSGTKVRVNEENPDAQAETEN